MTSPNLENRQKGTLSEEVEEKIEIVAKQATPQPPGVFFEDLQFLKKIDHMKLTADEEDEATKKMGWPPNFKSLEEKAFEIELVAEEILNLVDFPSLVNCRQVSKRLNLQASKTLFAKNYVAVSIDVSQPIKKLEDDSDEESLPWEQKTKIKSLTHDQMESKSESQLLAELEQQEGLNRFFSNYGDKLRFKNFYLHLQHEACTWFTLEAGRFEMCRQFGDHVTHLRIDAPFSIWMCMRDLVKMMCRLLPKMRSLHLPLMHVDDVSDLSGFLEPLNSLKVLITDKISPKMIESLLLLQHEAGEAIKGLTILEKIYVGPHLMALYLHCEQKYQFQWKIAHVKLNLFPAPPPMVRQFLEGQGPFLESLSIAIILPEDGDPAAGNIEQVLNFSYDYLPTFSLKKLKRLKLTKSVQLIPFMARNFLSTLSLPRIEEFKFWRSFQIKFSPSSTTPNGGEKNRDYILGELIDEDGGDLLLARIAQHLSTQDEDAVALDLKLKLDARLKVKLAPDDVNRLIYQFSLGDSMIRQKKFEEALPVFIDLVKILKEKLDQLTANVAVAEGQPLILHLMRNEVVDRCLKIYEGHQKMGQPFLENEFPVCADVNKKFTQVDHQQEQEQLLPYEESMEEKLIREALNKVAEIFCNIQKYDVAVLLNFSEKLNQFDLKTFGPEHNAILKSHLNLVNIYKKLGRSKEALQFQRKVMEIQEKQLGPHHPINMENRINFAQILLANDEGEEAVTLLQKNCDLGGQFFGPEHELTLGSRCLITLALNNLERYEEALQRCRQNVEVHIRLFGKNSHETLCNLYQMGRALRGLKENERAFQIYKEVVQGQMTTLGPDDETTLETQHELAEFLKEMGQDAEAKRLFQVIYEARVRISGTSHPADLVQEMGGQDLI